MISIHPTALVASKRSATARASGRSSTSSPGARIGRDCNICDRCFVENDVVLGDRVTVKCGVSLYDGLVLEDDVFVGPDVTFANDPRPRSGRHPDGVARTRVREGASLGAGAILLPGVTVGRFAMVGAGALVTPRRAGLRAGLRKPGRRPRPRLPLRRRRCRFDGGGAEARCSCGERYRARRRRHRPRVRMSAGAAGVAPRVAFGDLARGLSRPSAPAIDAAIAPRALAAAASSSDDEVRRFEEEFARWRSASPTSSRAGTARRRSRSRSPRRA